jgi:hypothetical protein
MGRLLLTVTERLLLLVVIGTLLEGVPDEMLATATADLLLTDAVRLL